MEKGVVIIANPSEKGYGFSKGVHDYIISKKERNFDIDIDNVIKTKFKDGEYKVKIEKNLRGRRCFYIHDPNINAVEWVSDLLFTLNAIKYASPSEINVIFPYFRYARQDRKDESRVSVNAKAIAGVVDSYAHRAMSLDIHSPTEQGFFNVPFDDLKSSPVVVDYFKKNHRSILENLVLISPDVGGGKRVDAFGKILAREDIEAEIAMCYKRRSKENEVEEIIVVGEVKGKDCLIIDDILDTGGTIDKTAGSLIKEGAKSVNAYCTFGLFNGKKKFDNIGKLFVSDAFGVNNKINCEKIGMVNLFGEAIYRTIMGESLSSLFE